jgi:hypothetical protein
MSFDRVRESSVTTGTGPLTLAGAPTGFRTFASVYTPGAGGTVHYVIEGVDANGVQTGEWEVGTGSINGGGALVRSVVVASSNAGALVNFSAGMKRVYDAATVGAVDAAIDAAIVDHSAATDPHGDRAYAAPASHASQHQDGGSDEVATATPAAGAIPKAGVTGLLDPGWLPDSAGGVFSLASVGASDGWGIPGEWWVKALGTQQIVANSQILLPFTATRSGVLVGVEVCVTTPSGVGGSVIVVSLYEETPVAGAYVGGGAKIADLATLASDSSGSKSVVGLSVPLVAGRAYLLTLSASHTATIWAAAVDAAGARNIRADSTVSNRGRQANLPMAQGSSYPPPATAPTFPGSLTNVGASGSPSQILWPPLMRLQ